jgi:hypothetical protein
MRVAVSSVQKNQAASSPRLCRGFLQRDDLREYVATANPRQSRGLTT